MNGSRDDEGFGWLRGILNGPPGEDAWMEMCWWLADQPAARVSEVFLPYLDGAARRWPDDVRVVPPADLERRIRRDLPAPVYLPACRSVLSPQRPLFAPSADALTRLLSWGDLDAITQLSLASCVLDLETVRQLTARFDHGDLPALHTLSLADAAFASAEAASALCSAPLMTQLEELTLFREYTRGFNAALDLLPRIGEFPNLRRLRVGHGRVAGPPARSALVASLEGLDAPQLDTLALHEVRLSGVLLEVFLDALTHRRWPSLRRVDLSRAAVRDDALPALFAALAAQQVEDLRIHIDSFSNAPGWVDALCAQDWPALRSFGVYGEDRHHGRALAGTALESRVVFPHEEELRMWWFDPGTARLGFPQPRPSQGAVAGTTRCARRQLDRDTIVVSPDVSASAAIRLADALAPSVWRLFVRSTSAHRAAPSVFEALAAHDLFAAQIEALMIQTFDPSCRVGHMRGFASWRGLRSLRVSLRLDALESCASWLTPEVFPGVQALFLDDDQHDWLLHSDTDTAEALVRHLLDAGWLAQLHTLKFPYMREVAPETLDGLFHHDDFGNLRTLHLPTMREEALRQLASAPRVGALRTLGLHLHADIMRASAPLIRNESGFHDSIRATYDAYLS